VTLGPSCVLEAGHGVETLNVNNRKLQLSQV
jgi:hypothetical protein